jgi:hypothetical protein
MLWDVTWILKRYVTLSVHTLQTTTTNPHQQTARRSTKSVSFVSVRFEKVRIWLRCHHIRIVTSTCISKSVTLRHCHLLVNEQVRSFGWGPWQEKTCSSATAFTSNLTRTDLGLNSGLCCKKPATNRSTYDVASLCYYIRTFPTGYLTELDRHAALRCRYHKTSVE